MEIREIKAVLENWNYQEALAIYEKHSNNSFLKRLFSSGPDSYNTGKLKEELYEILATLKQSPPEKESQDNIEDRAGELRHPEPTEEPEAIQEAARKRTKTYQEAAHLHSQLERMETNEERKQAASRIVELFKERDACWKILDEYKTTGKVPDQEPSPQNQPLPDDHLQLHKILMNNRSYISKNRSSKKPSILEKIAIRTAQNEEIERRLNEQTS